MSQNNGQPPGPSDDTLKHLAEILPSFAKAVVEGKVTGKGRKVPPSRPRKMCPVCMKTFDIGPSEIIAPKPENCEKCQALLADGYIAFTSGDRFAFAKSERLKDMAGKVIRISEPIFQKLADAFELEWKKTEDKA